MSRVARSTSLNCDLDLRTISEVMREENSKFEDSIVSGAKMITIEKHFEFINSLCELAYLFGQDIARLGGGRDHPDMESERIILEPMVVLAWEAGYDSYYQGS